jgi:hypothetical protein
MFFQFSQKMKNKKDLDETKVAFGAKTDLEALQQKKLKLIKLQFEYIV